VIVRRWGSSYTGVAGWVNIPKRVQFSLWDASDPIIDVRRFAESPLRPRFAMFKAPKVAAAESISAAIVPRHQSDAIVEALKRNNVPHVYHVYEGEGHGWRKRDTIEHFYRTVEAFLRQHVLFA
jgi:hypothetical protein